MTSVEGAVLLGDLQGGVKEIWGLPVSFLESFSFHGRGFTSPEGMLVLPWLVQRSLGGEKEERWVECWGKAGAKGFFGRLENRWKGDREFELEIRGAPKLCAPYPPGVLGAVDLFFDEEGKSFEFKDRAAGFCARLDFSQAFASLEVEEESQDPVGFALRLKGSLGMGRALEWRLTLGSSIEGVRKGQQEIAKRSARELLHEAEEDFLARLEPRLRVNLDHGGEARWDWLRAEAGDFFVRIPSGPQGPEQAGLLTGLGGKDGFQFSGGQGLWLSRALLGSGASEAVRAHLELLSSHQGPSGEILHQLSPAGPRTFGSSETTPLFVDLLWRYVEWTGDLEFAEKLFPSVRRALAFLDESDRDGDGISECTDVGPGWVLNGPLREGLVAEVYHLSLQAAALRAAVQLAKVLDVPGGGTEWERHEKQLLGHLEKRFFDPDRGFFAHGLLGDGSFDRRESALALFPLLFFQADRSQADQVLARLETPDFSTPWGLRLLPRSDPDFDPGSPWGGEADPMLGLLLALTEMLYGKGEQGFGRLAKLLETIREKKNMGEGRLLAMAAQGLGILEGVLGAHVRPDGESLGLRIVLPPDQESLSFDELHFRGLVLEGEISWSSGGKKLNVQLAVKGEGQRSLSLGLYIPKGWDVETSKEGDLELCASMEPGLEGGFFVAEDRVLHAGDRIEWGVSLRPLPELAQETTPKGFLDVPSIPQEAPKELEDPLLANLPQNSLRIAHICHGYPPEFHGGTEHYVQGLAQAQKKQGHSPLVIAGRGLACSGVEREEYEGIPVFRLGKNLLYHERWYHGFSPEILGELLQVLQDENINLVHIHHWMRLSFDLGAWVRAFGLPTVVTLHDLSTTCPRALRIQEGSKFCETEIGVEKCIPCVPREDWMRNEDLDFLLDWFSFAQERELHVGGALLAPSQAQRDFLLNKVDKELKIKVIPHGCLPSMKPLLESRRQGSLQKGEPLKLAYWGHIQPLKGVHLILEAVGRLDDPKRIKVLLWGEADDPFYASQLEELGQGLDLEWKQKFEPEDLVNLEADIAVFPSLAHETWSFVLDEAFAKGLPVLCSNRGALPERVGKAGLVFEAGDSASLAEKLQDILEHPALLEEFVEHLPSLQPMDGHAKELELIYRELAIEEWSPEELSKMRKETLNLLEDLKRWEETTRRHEERCRELLGLREKAESERGNLQDDLKEALRSVEDYKERLATEETRIKDLLGQREEARQDLENHKSLVKELRADLGQHQKELSKAREDFRKTEAYLIENQKNLEERNAKLLLSQKEVEKAKNEVEEGKVRIQAFETELEELRNSLLGLHKDLSACQEDLGACQEDLGACKEELGACSHRERKLRRENRFAFLLTIPAKLLFGLWDRIRGK
jgi:glycosyltransferase involved in cell wall biosynthesis